MFDWGSEPHPRRGWGRGGDSDKVMLKFGGKGFVWTRSSKPRCYYLQIYLLSISRSMARV